MHAGVLDPRWSLRNDQVDWFGFREAALLSSEVGRDTVARAGRPHEQRRALHYPQRPAHASTLGHAFATGTPSII